MDYFDILLAKKLEDDRDPKVEGLSVSANGRYHEDGVVYDPVIVNVPETPLSKLTVTENGTYTAPSGTAYNEVEVDVPLPENAYLLKDIPNTPTAIATFTDGSDLPMSKLEVGIEPIQEGSGDPSPTNVRPISGWDEVNVGVAGKNLWNNNWSAYTQPSDYRICPIKLENGQYTASVKLKEGGTRQSGFTLGIAKQGDRYTNFGSFYTASTGADKTGTITVDDAWTAPKLIVYCSNESAFNAIFENYEIQLEEGSTATTYEPYNGTTYTIDLDGTRYGGKVDLVNGVLTVDRAIVDMGTLSWNYDSGIFTASINGIKNGVYTDTNLMSSIYPVKPMSYSQFDYGMRYNSTTSIGIKDSRYTDATTFKAAMDGVQLVYELATPQTIQLTPTVVKSLRGMNNVWADSGNILDLSYLAKEE